MSRAIGINFAYELFGSSWAGILGKSMKFTFFNPCILSSSWTVCFASAALDTLYLLRRSSNCPDFQCFSSSLRICVKETPWMASQTGKFLLCRSLCYFLIFRIVIAASTKKDVWNTVEKVISSGRFICNKLATENTELPRLLPTADYPAMYVGCWWLRFSRCWYYV